jgi:ABC-2 type transport system permease protein
MRGVLQSSFVIARRDFTATVMSRSFLLFLLAPLLIIGISFGFGGMTSKMARQDTHPSVAVIASVADFAPIEAARARLNPAFGENTLPDLVRAEPDYVLARQVSTLLESREQRINAVLTGGLDAPRLTGDVPKGGRIDRQIGAIVDEARQLRTLGGAHPAAPVRMALVQTQQAQGAVAAKRSGTARAAQMLLFMLSLTLAGMLLSNLVEEKTNKIIEVLAAAVPIDAVFLGKLAAMLGVSLVGILVWAGGGAAALAMWGDGIGGMPEPAVGWPLFVALVLVYFSANYLLLGALFLGIGSQASSVREVQTLSMPITIAQVLFFLLASMAVSQSNGLLGIAGAAFPFSSPLTMVARAAQAPELWPHALALVWQALWVWLMVQLGAGLFRRNVLKSGSSTAMMDRMRRRKAAA